MEKLIIKNSTGEMVELDACIIISTERYSELLKKEIGYDYRQSELKGNSYLSIADKVMFGLNEE